MSVITENLKAKLRLYKDMWNELEYIVERVVVDDLEYNFKPNVSENGEYKIVWRVVFQRTVSNPMRFKFLEARCSFPQVSWIPFMPKKVRERANKDIEDKAQEKLDEIKKIFGKGDYFEEIDT